MCGGQTGNSTYKLCRASFYFGISVDFRTFNFTDGGTTCSCNTLGASGGPTTDIDYYQFYMTPNQFTDTYKRLSDEKLLDIIDNKSDYQPLAIETAIFELNSRHLTDKQISDAKQLNIDNKNKKAKADKIIQDHIETAKKTADKAFTLFDPFIEKTPERSIKVICLVLGILSIAKFISQYYYFKYMFTDANRLELADFFIFLEMLYLPITLVFLWRLKKIGRLLFSVWAIYNLLSAIGIFVLMLINSSSVYKSSLFTPQTDISTFVFTLLISGGLLYHINKKDIKVLFN